MDDVKLPEPIKHIAKERAWQYVGASPRDERTTDWNKVFSQRTFLAGAEWMYQWLTKELPESRTEDKNG